VLAGTTGTSRGRKEKEDGIARGWTGQRYESLNNSGVDKEAEPPVMGEGRCGRGRKEVAGRAKLACS